MHKTSSFPLLAAYLFQRIPISVSVRDPSLRIAFRSCSPSFWQSSVEGFGSLLKVETIGGCASYCPLAPPEPLCSVLGDRSVRAESRLFSSLAFSQACPTGSTTRRGKWALLVEKEGVAAFLPSPPSQAAFQEQLPPFIPFRPKEPKPPSIPCWFPSILSTSLKIQLTPEQCRS